jgi:hypothetical protein
LERLKQGKYNKPHWLRYIGGHEPLGPTEEEEEEETKNLQLQIRIHDVSPFPHVSASDGHHQGAILLFKT